MQEGVVLEVEEEADAGLEEAGLAEGVVDGGAAHSHDGLHQLHELQAPVAQSVAAGLALVEEGLAGVVDKVLPQDGFEPRDVGQQLVADGVDLFAHHEEVFLVLAFHGLRHHALLERQAGLKQTRVQ